MAISPIFSVSGKTVVAPLHGKFPTIYVGKEAKKEGERRMRKTGSLANVAADHTQKERYKDGVLLFLSFAIVHQRFSSSEDAFEGRCEDEEEGGGDYSDLGGRGGAVVQAVSPVGELVHPLQVGLRHKISLIIVN